MEDDIDALPKSSWWKLDDSPSASPKNSNFPKIPIKIPIIQRLRNKSKRKDRSVLIPEDNEPMKTSGKKKSATRVSAKQKDTPPVAPIAPFSPIIQRFQYRSRRKERSSLIPENVIENRATVTALTPKKEKDTALDPNSEIRKREVFDAIDRATSMEKAIISKFSPGNSEKKPPSLSPASFKRVQSEGSFDRWNSYSTLRTAELSTSTASPHSIRSTGRHKHRVRAAQSWSQSRSSPEHSREFAELSPGHDSKRSLTISELGPSSKRSLTISELGSSFSSRPPKSSTNIRTSGSNSSHVRTSAGSSSQVLPASMMGSRRSISAHSRSIAVDPSERSTMQSSSIRSSVSRSILRSSRTEQRKKTEKQLSLAQSSSQTNLENYGKLAERRSSATQESLASATKMLHKELEVGELSSLLGTGDAGSSIQQRALDSNRSHRSISLRSERTASLHSGRSGSRSGRSGRSGSRRSRSRRSKSPSHRQRSLHEIMTADSFMSSDSSSNGGISSLGGSSSVEARLRRSLAEASKESTPPRKQSTRRKSQKEKNDRVDSSLMARRGSLNISTSLHTGDSSMLNSKSQDSSDQFFFTQESPSRLAAREPRQSTRTSSNSKRSTRTSGNSKRTSKTTEKKKKSSPRRKSAAASLRDIPRTIQFVTKEPPSPPSPPDDTKSKSSKTSSSKSSPMSSKSSSKVSPMSSKSSSKVSPMSSNSASKKPARKLSPKAASTGARLEFKTKTKKQSKRISKKDQDQSSASHASGSLASLFGTAFCLDHSSHHNPTTSPFLQYDVALNDDMPQTAVRQQSMGSLVSRGRGSFGSLDGSGDEFALTEEEEEGEGGGASAAMSSPSVSLESDFLSAATPPTGPRLPALQHKKKTKTKSPFMRKKKKKRPSTKKPPPIAKLS